MRRQLDPESPDHRRDHQHQLCEGKGCPDAGPWTAFQGKIFNALPMIGAPGSAALPLGLDRAWTTGVVKPGTRALLLGMETTKWIYAGAIVDWAAPTPAA